MAANDRRAGRTAALYNKVLGGRFIPEAVKEDDDTASDVTGKATKSESALKSAAQAKDGDPFANSTEAVPELKTVVQFDNHTGRHVIEFQSYSFDDEDSKDAAAADEADPFRVFPVLLKAIISTGSRLQWRLEIQSPEIVDIFRKIAYKHKELDLTKDVLVIEHPFRCLFFLRDEIGRRAKELSSADKDTSEDATTATTRIGLTQLLRFIRSPMCHQREIATYEKRVVKHGQISFFLMWMVCRPYEPIVRVRPGQPLEDSQVYILQSLQPDYIRDEDNEKRPVWLLTLLFGCHDGETFSIKSKGKYLHYFQGFRSLSHSDVAFVPLWFLEAQPGQEGLREKLIARGKRYIDIAKQPYTVWQVNGSAYLNNSGKGEEIRQQLEKKTVQLDERVIVDRSRQSSIGNVVADRGAFNSNRLRKVLPQAAKPRQPESGTPDDDDDDDDDDDISEPDAPLAAAETNTAGVGPMSSKWTQEDNEWDFLENPVYTGSQAEPMDDDDYLVCRNVIAGFALKQKVWVKMLKTNSLQKIEYTADPFISLQMPSQKKHFIRRLVEGFRKSKDGSYDDVIEGKGRGLIFLLYGPPGLGKTLTAESVAEVAERPLYHISAGELSTDVSTLESELQTIFKMGARWDAVVLLDEADVLMSQRTTNNLERNSVVAVFLRMLEYYRGMLFLTTNRRDDFDDAFFNRIHVTLKYNELDATSRTNIWRHHLVRATRDNVNRPDTEGHSLWTEEMYETLGRIQLNGRDIKNYVRVAYTYAHAVDGEDLGLEQVLAVLQNSLSSPGYALSRGIRDSTGEDEDGGVNSKEHVLQDLCDLLEKVRTHSRVTEVEC